MYVRYVCVHAFAFIVETAVGSFHGYCGETCVASHGSPKNGGGLSLVLLILGIKLGHQTYTCSSRLPCSYVTRPNFHSCLSEEVQQRKNCSRRVRVSLQELRPFLCWVPVIHSVDTRIRHTHTHARALARGLLKNWSLSWIGNLMGSVLLAKLVMLAGINAAPGTATAIAVSKVSTPCCQTFLKGIICNWMVCMAGEKEEEEE